MNIKLTVRQRISIESLFGAREPRTLRELMVPFEILRKITLPKEDKAKYMQVQGERVFLTEAATEAPEFAVDLTPAEVEELESFLRTVKLQPMDLEWALPLKKQLEGQA